MWTIYVMQCFVARGSILSRNNYHHAETRCKSTVKGQTIKHSYGESVWKGIRSFQSLSSIDGLPMMMSCPLTGWMANLHHRHFWNSCRVIAPAVAPSIANACPMDWNVQTCVDLQNVKILKQLTWMRRYSVIQMTTRKKKREKQMKKNSSTVSVGIQYVVFVMYWCTASTGHHTCTANSGHYTWSSFCLSYISVRYHWFWKS